MNKTIFREKSLERVESPEKLNDYVQIASPSVWLLLVGVLLLLAGLCVWSVFGALNTTLDTAAIVKDGTAQCILLRDAADQVETGMAVRIEEQETVLETVEKTPVKAAQLQEEYALYLAGITEEDWVCLAEADTDLPDGVYEAKIVVNSVKPISFVLN